MGKKISRPRADFADLLLDAVCFVDSAGLFVYASAAFERIFGYSPDEIVGTRMIDLVAPEDRERTLRAAGEIMSGDHKFHFENRYVRKDGRVVDIMWSARWSEVDQLRIAVARDVTALKIAGLKQAAVYAISEAAHTAEDIKSLLRLIHQIISNLLPVTSLSVAIFDEGSDTLTFPYHADQHHEPSAGRGPAITAFCSAVLRQQKPLLLTQEQLTTLPAELQALAGSAAVCWLGVPLESVDGAIGVIVLRSYAGEACYCENDVELMHFVSTQVVTAIERKRMNARLQYLAQYDTLTGLPNRGLLSDRLELLLARARRQSSRFAVLFLDLDRFKQVNDFLGHAAGDLLLQHVASQLKLCLRESDTVARVGGDEFVILLEDVQQPSCVETTMDKIRKAVNQAIIITGHPVRIQASIGASMYPEHGSSADELLKHADDAMYGDKNNLSAQQQ